MTEFDPPQGLAPDSVASESGSHSPSSVRKRYSCRPDGSSTSTSQSPACTLARGIGFVSHSVNDPTKATDFAFGCFILKRTFFVGCFAELCLEAVVVAVLGMVLVFMGIYGFEKMKRYQNQYCGCVKVSTPSAAREAILRTACDARREGPTLLYIVSAATPGPSEGMRQDWGSGMAGFVLKTAVWVVLVPKSRS